VAGFIDNPLLGISNANRGERWGGRVSILFTPTERMSFRATGVRQVQEFDDNGTLELVGAASSLNNPPANQFDVANNGRPAQSSFLGNPSRNVYEYVNLIADFDLGFGDFVSSTSLGRLSTEFRGDISFGLLAPGLTISDALSLGVYGERVAASQVQTNASDRVNQELRLSSKPDSQLFGIRADWQAGFFYAREEIQFDQSFDVISVETGNLLTAPLPGGGTEAPAEYEEYSGFANTTIYFSDDLDLHLGGRYTDNTQRSQIFSLFGFVNPGGDTVSVPIESSETEFTYSTALRWRFNPDSLLYGRIATGFRPGGPNFAVSTLPPNVPATYEADTTTNYEIGLRTALFDRSVTIDVAAFYIDWNDIQVATTFNADGINTTVIANGGAARSQGLEWNFGWSPAVGLRLSAVGAYTDATLTEDAPALGGNAGDRLPFVPKWSNTVNLDYDTEVKPGVTGFAGLSWVYVGERFTSFSSTPAFPGYFELPSYNMVHMQAGLTFDHFDVSLYVRNIGNSQAPTGYVPQGGFGGTGTGNIVQPRTIGLRAGVRF